MGSYLLIYKVFAVYFSDIVRFASQNSQTGDRKITLKINLGKKKKKEIKRKEKDKKR